LEIQKKLLSGEGAHSRRFTRPATRLRALFSKLTSHSVFTAGLPGFFTIVFNNLSLVCSALRQVQLMMVPLDPVFSSSL